MYKFVSTYQNFGLVHTVMQKDTPSIMLLVYDLVFNMWINPDAKRNALVCIKANENTNFFELLRRIELSV